MFYTIFYTIFNILLSIPTLKFFFYLIAFDNLNSSTKIIKRRLFELIYNSIVDTLLSRMITDYFLLYGHVFNIYIFLRL